MNGDAMDDPAVTYPVPDARPHVEQPPRRRPGRPPTGVVPIKDDTTPTSCPECNAVVSRKYLSTHRRKQHGVISRRSKHDLAPLPGNDVVTTVLGVIFPGGIPIQHLDAVLRWRDATVAFLREVQ